MFPKSKTWSLTRCTLLTHTRTIYLTKTTIKHSKLSRLNYFVTNNTPQSTYCNLPVIADPFDSNGSVERVTRRRWPLPLWRVTSNGLAQNDWKIHNTVSTKIPPFHPNSLFWDYGRTRGDFLGGIAGFFKNILKNSFKIKNWKQ